MIAWIKAIIAKRSKRKKLEEDLINDLKRIFEAYFLEYCEDEVKWINLSESMSIVKSKHNLIFDKGDKYIVHAGGVAIIREMGVKVRPC